MTPEGSNPTPRGALPALPALPAPEAPAGALPPPMERFPARPTQMPHPTYYPFFLAMGVAFIGWGLISTWIITVGGLILLLISLIGWINILRHEH